MDLKNTGYDVAYDHIGIPTIHPSEGEVYQADISAHVYRVGTDGLRIEKIRFDTDAPFPQDVKPS